MCTSGDFTVSIELPTDIWIMWQKFKRNKNPKKYKAYQNLPNHFKEYLLEQITKQLSKRPMIEGYDNAK